MAEESKELRLARYLREFVGLRTTNIRDVSKYDSVLWLAEMPQESECTSPAWIDGGEVGESWLEVRKQQMPKTPDPSDIVLPWADKVALRKATEDLPSLNPVAFFPDDAAELEDDEEPPLVQRHLVDHPEVVVAYDRFRPTWEDWSIQYRRRQRIQTRLCRIVWTLYTIAEAGRNRRNRSGTRAAGMANLGQGTDCFDPPSRRSSSGRPEVRSTIRHHSARMSFRRRRSPDRR